MNPNIQIAVGVIAAITLVGVIVSFIKKSSLYKGYEDYKAEIPKIANAIKGEMFRDGDDLVIAGTYKRNPVQVRFSYSETTPGLNMRMQAPVSFTFSVVPKGERATEGRVLVRTGDDMFDAKFAARTDHPTQAKMLVGSKQMRGQMEKLCCSSKTFLTLTRGSIESSELTIPEPYTGRHVLDHLESMAILAAAVDDIPGAETIKIQPYEREKTTPVFRIALAVGAICALIAVFVMKPVPSQPEFGDASRDINHADGVNALDAQVIQGLAGSHAARPEEFDGDVVGWLKGNGKDASGRVELKLNSEAEKDDVAYWLHADNGEKDRITLVQAGKPIYDVFYPNVIGIARLAHDDIGQVKWKVPPAKRTLGDGLVLVMRTGEDTKTQVLFASNGQVFSGTAQGYSTIPVQ